MAKLLIDRTFVRQDGQNRSVRQLAHAQFRDWTVAWYQRAGDTYDFGALETTNAEREKVLSYMVLRGIPPAMLGDDSEPPTPWRFVVEQAEALQAEWRYLAVIEQPDLLLLPVWAYQVLKPCILDDPQKANVQRVLPLIYAQGDWVRPELRELLEHMPWAACPRVRVGSMRFSCGKEVARA